MGTALHKFTCIKMLTMILWILAFLLFNVNVVVGNADGYCGKSSDGSANAIECTTSIKDHCKITKADAASAIVIELKTDQQFNEDVDWKEGYTEGYQYKTDCKDPSKTTRSSDHTTGDHTTGANPSGANPSGAPRSMMNAIFIAVPLFNMCI